MKQLSVRTHQRVEFVDITSEVRNAIRESGVDSGICVVYCPHTTGAVTINENADPSVPQDIIRELNSVIPFEDGYRHMEGNSAAHIKSSLVGASETIIIENGSPLLGRWQAVFFCDFDGPRQRNVYIKILKS